MWYNVHMDKLSDIVTDEYIYKLAEEQDKGKTYTVGKTGKKRYYYDDGTPVFPPNHGIDGETWVETLLPGVRVSRYGMDSGRCFSPESDDFHSRSLPIRKKLHVYIVKEPIQVTAGRVLPWFGEKGGGVQYTPVGKNANGEKLKIRDLKGKLEEI
ncbi:hypothetical protein FACS189499_08770 [Clostridia bacterium]|nr:hypothetical protein FACS189499_08770 [Clostridia bacterium]